MSRLEIALLGPPEARSSGRSLACKTRKTFALLAFLAVEGGMQRRERLIGLLWPDSDPDAAHTSVRGAIHYLREALAEAGAPGLVTDRNAVGLEDPARVQLDLADLQAAARNARQEGRLPAEARARLEAAARSWRGDFLEGFSLPDAPAFDDWAGTQAEAARVDYASVLAALHHHAIGAENPAAALDWATRWLALDPLAEEALRAVMRAHHIGGDRAAALNAFRRGAALLEAELGLAPSPETLALAAEFERSPGLTAPRPAAIWRPPRLVGRELAWRALEEAWDGGRLTFLSGEPGVGKSRLLNDFAASKGPYLRLDGRPGDVGVPFATLARFWSRLLGERRELELPEWVRQEMSRIVPSLAVKPLEPVAPTSGNLHLYEALAVATRAATRDAASVICDDFHLFDAASLEASAYIIADLQPFAGEGAPRVLCAYRSGELPLAHRSIVERLLDAGLSARIELAPLALAAVRDLLSDLGGPDLALLADQVERYTGGNPLFILETVRNLRETEGATNQVGDLGSLAPGGQVRELVRRRLERLSEGALRLARALAVVGEGFDLEDVAAVLEADPVALAQPLGELESTYVVKRDRFSHDVVREAVVAATPGPVLALLHRRALRVLERKPAPAAVLARHAEGAGLEDAVFRWSLQAGEEAARVQALGDAVPHLERALRVLQAAGAGGPSALAVSFEDAERLYDRLGQTHWYLGNLERAREIYELALHFARASGRQQLECSILNRLAALAASEGTDFGRAAALLQQAMRVAEGIGAAPGAATVGFRAWMARRYWFREASLAEADRALAMARDIGSRELTAGSLLGLAILKGLHLGQVGEAEHHVDEARSLFLAARDRALEVDCLCALVAARVQGGQPRAAVDAGRAALALARELGNPQGEVLAAFVLSVALVETGDYGAGLEVASRGVEVAREAGVPTTRFTSLMGLGHAKRAALALEEAERTLLEAHAVAVALASRPQVEMAAGSLCATFALMGDWPRALARAEQELALRDYAWLPPVTTPRWLVVDALERAGGAERASADLERLWPAAQASPRSGVPIRLARALLLERSGDLPAALAQLELAVALAAGSVVPRERWHLEAAFVRVLRGLGREAEVAAHHRAAASTIEELAASLTATPDRSRFLDRAKAIIERG